MVLTTAQLEEILSGLKSDKPKLGAERRRQPRLDVRGRIRVVPNQATPGGGPTDQFEAWVRDVSRGGIGLLCPRLLCAGDRFTARFARPGGDEITMEYVVSRCTKLPTGEFSVGARLVVGPRSPFGTALIRP
jgi:hypothetical protein